jgi:hypothetical protein
MTEVVVQGSALVVKLNTTLQSKAANTDMKGAQT